MTDEITLGKRINTDGSAYITVRDLMDAIFKADQGASEDAVFDLLTKHCNLENRPNKVHLSYF